MDMDMQTFSYEVFSVFSAARICTHYDGHIIWKIVKKLRGRKPKKIVYCCLCVGNT